MTQYSPTRRLLSAAFAALAIVSLSACGSDDTEKSADTSADTTTTTAAEHEEHGEHEGPHVLASTSWVGAIAKLAGAHDVTVVAPSNLQHPPDYDPKPSDLAKAADADFVLLAGFEGFATRLKEAAGSDAEVITVEPAYAPDKIEAQVQELAAKWGTEEHSAEHFEEYRAAYEKASEATKSAIAGATPVVVAQAYVAEWAVFAGLTPAGVYGEMNMPTPDDVAKLVALKPAFVFENSHMPMGADLVSASGATKVELVNFPGDDLDMMKVIETNQATITKALAGK